ncbi:hypothetical protein FVP63_04820 [Salinibacterium sp. dk5596]|nr:hypothetical protein FVP63_04820 [Salinibacterium sp. dk5596]
MAISETCINGSGPDCVLVNGEHIALPPSFERASVERAIASVGGQHSVSVTFDSDGAAIFTSLAEQAASAQPPTRMLLKIGGEVKAAVSVVEVPQTPHMEILFAPEENVDRLVELIQEG